MQRRSRHPFYGEQLDGLMRAEFELPDAELSMVLTTTSVIRQTDDHH
ncbi:MAG: hypothetical protein ACLR2O_02960 [Coprococcus sp.]